MKKLENVPSVPMFPSSTMDEGRFLRACKLRDERRLTDAYDEFVQLAEGEEDPLDKALILLHAANALEMSGQIDGAAREFSSAYALMKEHSTANSTKDEKFAALQLFLDYEDANLSWLRGDNLKVALNKFEATIKKHKLKAPANKHVTAPRDLYLRDFYDSIQIRRAFILADLDRWKKALSILEGIESPKEYREGVAFYLGHCYLAAHDYIRAQQKLTESLRLGGLPKSLEWRAHCELGMTYYNLGEFAKAKVELATGAELADASYIKESQVWGWLELTCRALGLRAEAEQYARLGRPS